MTPATPFRSTCAATLAALLAAGCATTEPSTDPQPTGFTVPAAYAGPVAEIEADGAPAPRPDDWPSLWDLFEPDHGLHDAAERALARNPDLAALATQLEELGYRVEQAEALRQPGVDFEAGVGQAETMPERGDDSSFNVGLDARWEIDLWGRLADQRAAAEADESAAAADLDAARRSIAAQAMQAWFELVTQARLHDLDRRQLESFQQTQDLILERFENGTGALRDLDLARTDTRLSQADLARQVEGLRRAGRNLEALAGSYPRALDPATLVLPDTAWSIRAGVPSDLIAQRPDVVAAWRRVEAADARVRVAETDRIPALVLTGSIGRRSSAVEDLFKSEFDVWSILGRLAQPVFDAGRRKAEVDASQARLRRAAAQYEGVLLDAFLEVENALDRDVQLAREEAEVSAALEAALRAEASTRLDYADGLVEFLDLLQTQRRVFNTESRLINLQNARRQNRVRLGLALGLGV